MLERTGVVDSMRRARSLSKGQFRRLFGVYLLTVLVATLVGYVVGLPLGIVGVVGAVATPFTSAVCSGSTWWTRAPTDCRLR